MILRRRSLSTRLLLLFLGAGLLTLLVVGSGFRFGFSQHLRDQLQPHLLAYLDYLERDLGTPPDPARAAAQRSRLPLEIRITGPQLDWRSPGLSDPGPSIDYRHRHGRFEFAHHGEHLYLRSRDGDYTVTYRAQARPPRSLTPVRVAVLGGVLLVLLALYLAIRRLLRPLHILARGVRRIGEGELQTRVEVVREDEIGQLTASVNQMAADIEQMLESKRQLLLAISHELRSPITRARVSVELLPESPPQQAISRDLATMTRLIEELIEGERLQGKHAIIQRTPVRLGPLVRELVAESWPERGITLRHRGADDEVALDPARLRLLLHNLLENALAHSPGDAAPPTIQTSQDRDQVSIEVHNHGPAIAPADLPHLTEPFYRADPSRRRTVGSSAGGYGLGLWLCRAIAEAHGGCLVIDSDEHHGTRVSVRLPLDQRAI